jgi:hypothetical protein
MSLQIEIDSYDYNTAVKAVQRLLDKITTNSNGNEVDVTNVPSGEEIVDLVWYCIK